MLCHSVQYAYHSIVSPKIIVIERTRVIKLLKFVILACLTNVLKTKMLGIGKMNVYILNYILGFR